MSDNFVIHSDPNESWLEITVEDLASVGLGPSQMSFASKRSGESIFLSEEPDANKFVYRFMDKNDSHLQYTFVEYAERSYIGDLPSLLEFDS